MPLPTPCSVTHGETKRSPRVKTLLLRSGAAGFTCARVRMTIGRPRPLPGYPTAPAFYPISVRQLRAWPKASSPPRLAATQLPSARGSHHQGPQRTSTSSINAMPGTQQKGRRGDRRPSSCAKHYLLADRRQAALVEEALHALALHLGGVDVALAVDGDVVEVFELTRTAPHAPEAADHLPVAAADHMDLAIGIVRGEPIGLPLIRPEHGRAGHARARRVAQDRDFTQKG